MVQVRAYDIPFAFMKRRGCFIMASPCMLSYVDATVDSKLNLHL